MSKSNINSLIGTYFKAWPDTQEVNATSIFNKPAEPHEIIEVEKSLSIEFPQDYKEFLQVTNGYVGDIGESYVMFNNIEDVFENTIVYTEFYPWITHIGSNGGGEMYVLDNRGIKPAYGILPYIGDDEDFISLGSTFEEFIKHLYFSDFWNR